jgi:D-alanine-D-alanine ligase
MKRVAVLRGGPSEEYAVSMLSGNAVLKALRESDQPHKDIVITKKGEWLEEGFVKSPEQALEAVDVVFVALHGSYGEDGQVQRILQRKGIPFTGSRALSSAIAFNKELTKNTLRPHGLSMPKHRRVHRDEIDRLDEEIPHIFKEVGRELFVKPLSNGSSLGARHIPDATFLKEALVDLLGTYEQVLVEEFIRGKEATVGVMNNFRNHPIYVLPVIEIIPPSGEALFSHEHKYSGKSQEIVPGRFSYHEKSKLSAAAELAHRVIACEHYSRSDFIVRDGEVYFLEINTLPGLTSESLFPKAAAAIGLNFTDLVTHLIENAHVQNRY